MCPRCYAQFDPDAPDRPMVDHWVFWGPLLGNGIFWVIFLLIFIHQTPFIYCLIIPLAIIFFYLGYSIDRRDCERIIGYFKNYGGRLLYIKYAPFGPGWRGSNASLYRVDFIDKYGVEQSRFCKTGPFSGVYFTEEE
jgi:hypothetical protein